MGSDRPLLDEVAVTSLGRVAVGCFGGSTSNKAYKNEDAMYCLQAPDQTWVFSVLLDAHHSSQSAQLLINHLKSKREELTQICSLATAFSELEPYIIKLLSEESYREACRSIQGETSCLFCYQSGAYLWWLSIGDCMAFLFHPELAALGQYALNQRQFYEWVGQVNTFDLPVPCYSSGRRQLRPGTNTILLVTDGLLECEGGYYESPQPLYHHFINDKPIIHNLNVLLQRMEAWQVRDSTSIICWEASNTAGAQYPSD